MNIREYVKKRDEMLMIMDIEGMKNLCREMNIGVPENDKTVMAGMHKTRLYITSILDELKEESKAWLKSNGFTTDIAW